MIPSASRYARCEEASHAVNPGLKLVGVVPTYDEPGILCHIVCHEGGVKVADVPLDRGALALLYERLGALLMTEFRRG